MSKKYEVGDLVHTLRADWEHDNPMLVIAGSGKCSCGCGKEVVTCKGINSHKIYEKDSSVFEYITSLEKLIEAEKDGKIDLINKLLKRKIKSDRI